MEHRMSNASDARVHVVDGDEGFRTALTHLLNASGLRAVSYRRAGEFLDSHPLDAPGCVVLDMWMPDLNGLELMDRLADRRDSLPVIFVSGRSDVELTVHALKAGAVDFLIKPVANERLLDSVRKAIRSDVARRAMRAELRTLRNRYATLDARERAVMTGVVAGKLNKQLAVELGTCERTVKSQRASLMRKLRLHSLAELVRAARLLELPEATGSGLYD